MAECCLFVCVSQSIQRRLEEIEVTFKDLEEKGVVLERSLREETGKNQELGEFPGSCRDPGWCFSSSKLPVRSLDKTFMQCFFIDLFLHCR